MSPSDNLPRRFARIYTAAITDVMDEMGLRRQTLPATIQPLSAGMRTAGYAFTVRGRAHSGSPRERDQTLRRFLGMLAAVPAESVLVLAAHDNVAAHFGELSAAWFRARKVRGAVIDGATRDAAAIMRMAFPTRAQPEAVTAREASRRTCTAERPNTVATSRPMTMSGHGERVTATAPAATSTAALPITSFREQIQADRILMSSPRRRQRSARHARFATNASVPTAPITSTVGVRPCAIFSATWTSTPTPNAAMMIPLSSAARACQTRPRPMT